MEQNGARPWYLRIVAEPVVPPGEDLVRVGLVADVPEDLVLRRVEQRVERDGELAGAEIRAEVAADLADGVDDRLANLLRDLLKLRLAQRVEIPGPLDSVEQARHTAGEDDSAGDAAATA